MEREYINFKKARDFGDILGDTFKFLKFEFKPLFKILFFYIGPFILISSLISGFYQAGEFKEALNFSNNDPFGTYRRMFSLEYLVVFISTVAAHALIITALFSYIQLYISNGKDGFTSEDVKRRILKKFLPAFGGLLVVVAIAGISLIFCLIPILVVLTMFSLVLPAIIFADKGLGSAIERSFFLVKEHFWFTLGIGVVIVIIAYVAVVLLAVPMFVIGIFESLASRSGDITSDSNNILIIILTVVTSFCTFLIFIIPHTSMALHYFSQIEKKESPDLINKIEQINQPEDNDDTGLQY